jgi:hypothetical protein
MNPTLAATAQARKPHQFVGGTSDAHPELCDRCEVHYDLHPKQPVMLDLFAGRLGWSMPFLEAGWRVVAFDMELPNIPIPDGVEYVLGDIMQITADELRKYGACFATCSSPCEEFSVHGMKHFHPNPKWPANGIRLFNHARALLEELDIMYVMENVRPARSFVGPSVNHCGPFHLWGPGVPATFPPEAYKSTKGLMTTWIDSKGRTRTQGPQGRAGRPAGENTVAASRERTAKAAQIPRLISQTVCELASHYIPKETL